MKVISRNWHIILLLLLITIYIVTFSALSILRHNAFSSGYDLSNMDQTIWNTLHGRIFTMTGDTSTVSRLSTHADFILILLSPLYLIWNNVRILLIIQSFSLSLGALPLYLLSNKILNNKFLSLVIAAVYLLNPGLQWTNIYDFHAVALAIPLTITTFYFAYTKHWNWYWLFFALTITTKEEFSLSLAILGVFLAIFLKAWKVGIASFFIGVGWFLVMTFKVIPLFNVNNQHWAFNEWFSTVKTDLDDRNIVNLIKVLAKSIFRTDTFYYYHILFRPFAYLPIFGIPWLFAAAPDLLINTMSSQPFMRSLMSHYTSGITPAYTIATIFALERLKKLINYLTNKYRFYMYKKCLLYALGFTLLASALWSNYQDSPLPTTPACWCQIYVVDDTDKRYEEALKKIPENASVVASRETRPHISHRENIYTISNNPPQADYYALITKSRGNWDIRPNMQETNLIKKLLSNSDYITEFHEGNFYLIKKKG